jgi:hypothetical protein
MRWRGEGALEQGAARKPLYAPSLWLHRRSRGEGALAFFARRCLKMARQREPGLPVAIPHAPGA